MAVQIERTLDERRRHTRRDDERLERARRFRPLHLAERVERHQSVRLGQRLIFDPRDEVWQRRSGPQLPDDAGLRRGERRALALYSRVDGVLASACGNTERFEVPAIATVVLRDQAAHRLEPLGRRLDLPRILIDGQHRGRVLHHQRDLAPHLRRRVTDERARRREHVGAVQARHAQSKNAEARVRVLQRFLNRLRSVGAESAKEPQARARAIGVALAPHSLEEWHGGLTLRFDRLIRHELARCIRRRERCGQARVGRHVERGNGGTVARRRQAIDAASVAFEVAHVVTADARVVPIGDEHGTVRCDGDVRRARPRVGAHVEHVFADGAIAGALRRDRVHREDALAGLRVEHLAAILRRQQRAFVDEQAARRTGAEPEQVRRRRPAAPDASACRDLRAMCDSAVHGTRSCRPRPDTSAAPSRCRHRRCQSGRRCRTNRRRARTDCGSSARGFRGRCRRDSSGARRPGSSPRGCRPAPCPATRSAGPTCP